MEDSMKFLLGKIALLAMMISTQQVFADSGSYELSKLDIFKSCKTGTIQERNGRNALNYLEAFSSWHIKDQMNILDPNSISWHSSLAGLLEANPQLQAYVPFKNGQFSTEQYVATMAFLAFANDIEKYTVTPTRVDCVGDDTVVLITDFKGLQIRRDETTGCATHGLAFGSPTKIEIRYKHYYDPSNRNIPTKSLVYRVYSNLNDSISAQVRIDLAKIVQGPPNLQPNPANCKTRKQILEDFQNQADN